MSQAATQEPVNRCSVDPSTMALAQHHWHSPFEAMPLELHVIVLRHLSGPEDVLSTIRASPAALHALQTGRERIYVAVIQTRLAPEVFREFLAILNAPDHDTWFVYPR